MCTVPLSLHTHTSRSSGRNATPYISALSEPRLSSRMSFPLTASHIRISVPREEVVARNWPEAGTDRVVKAVVWAAMIATGCLVGAGGGGRGGIDDGGPIGCGGGHGGRWTSCTCPVWRPGIASSVECVPVARASRPANGNIASALQRARLCILEDCNDIVPRVLSQVSHSLNLVIDVSTLNTTTLLRNATASHPLRQANPRTRSLNSSSATSFSCASSQKITLFGGYRGLRPPPTSKRSDDVCKGTANASVPPVISATYSLNTSTSRC